MTRPVGSQPPSVYWRRRVVLLVSVTALVGLIVLTVRVLISGDATSTAASTTGTPTASSATTASAASQATPTSHHPTSHTAGTHTAASHAAGSHTPTARGSSPNHSSARSSSAPPPPPPPKQCVVSSLGLAAASDQTRYSVGDQPVLSILVTNKSSTPCVQDLADPQIELRVYNGESRVWGSHDCKVIPGTNPRTLLGSSTVRVSVGWTGLSSQPKCAGTRQRVGAGSYTLYASLAGREATAAQFTIA